MGLLKKYEDGDSNLTKLIFETTTTPNSQLHYEYSINGIPNIPFKPIPSNLDLNGKIPDTNYRDNAPEGTSF